MRRLICAAVALLALSACGGDPPKPDPPPSPTESSSSPTADAVPTLPAKAQGTTKKSAKAFVRFYVRSVNRATVTGETEGLRALGQEDCAACNSLLSTIDDTYAAGGRFEGGTWNFQGLSNVVPGPKGKVGVVARLQDAEQVWVKKRGAKPRRYEGGASLVWVFTLIKQTDRWSVLGFYRDKS